MIQYIYMESLFPFPCVAIDGDFAIKNDSLEALGLPQEEEDLDHILAVQEMPFDQFISVGDRWMPTKESYEKALLGDFDACWVQFEGGSFLVPWSRKRFKKELAEFAKNYYDKYSEKIKENQ